MSEYHVSFHVEFRTEGGFVNTAFGDMLFRPNHRGSISRKDVEDMKDIIKKHNARKRRSVEEVIIIFWHKLDNAPPTPPAAA